MGRLSPLDSHLRVERAAPLAIALFAVLAVFGARSAWAQEFAYCDFSATTVDDRLHVNGNAAVSGNDLLVTPAQAYQGGSAFHKVPITLTPGTSLYQQFRVKIYTDEPSSAPPNGADGFAFMLQSSGLYALGGVGQGFGYKGISPSLAIELDTYENPAENDPDGNHVAVLVNGVVDHASQPAVSVPFSLESERTRDVWIDYDGTTGTLSVYISDNPPDLSTLPVKPATPIITSTAVPDLSALLGQQAWAGFSASTGAQLDEHRVSFWVLSTQPLTDTDANGLPDLCDCKVNVNSCGGNIPVCDPVTLEGYCRPCQSNADCAPFGASKPVCHEHGPCAECSRADTSRCPVEAPACSDVTRACAPCNGDYQSDATAPCPTSDKPVCVTQGSNAGHCVAAPLPDGGEPPEPDGGSENGDGGEPNEPGANDGGTDEPTPGGEEPTVKPGCDCTNAPGALSGLMLLALARIALRLRERRPRSRS